MKIQITEKLELREDENWRVNLHSFCNLIQILFNELNLLKQTLGKSKYLENAVDYIRDLNEALSDPEHTIHLLKNLNNFKANVFNEIDKAVVNTYNLDNLRLNKIEESLISLDKVVRILEDRTKEFLRLIIHKDQWVKFDTFMLYEKLKDALETMEIRAKGRYGITFDPKTHNEHDYYFDINLASNLENVSLPALFPDIIRDVIANAKKYSFPGDTITCRLTQANDKITFVVRDNGRGIPENELPNVVKYGYRASNVTDKETYGDGFGLTKAYLITTENNGKMWIDSEVNNYTEITIEIPMPV